MSAYLLKDIRLRFFSVAFSLDGNRIVSGSFDRTIRLWNAKTGKQLRPLLEGHEDEVKSVAFSDCGMQKQVNSTS